MREAGILLPVFSLPGAGPVGALGEDARRFLDFLTQAGQKWWQVLPLGPTGYGNSPYQSFSAFAGNPLLIDWTELGFRPEENGMDRGRADYDRAAQWAEEGFSLVGREFCRAHEGEYGAFCDENAWWLEDYALFMAARRAHPGRPWYEWPEELKRRAEAALSAVRERERDEIERVKEKQFLFFFQWDKVKKYAGEKGVKLMGDLPFYVALDSADVWAHPEWFQLEEDGRPKAVAGVPPDPYAADGQVWGTPLFHWENMKKDGYAFWKKRVEAAEALFDKVRIDHFRGFDSYCAIPYGDETAARGEWKRGPGMDFFRALGEEHRERLVAEDLGILTESAAALLQETGIPGMKVLQFAFEGGDSPYLPHNVGKHCVMYTGTHDNDTCLGWYRSAGEREKTYAREYLRLHEGEWENWGMMKTVWGSRAELAIIPLQDILSLGSEARMNVPGTVGPANWSWRAREEDLSEGLAQAVRHQMEVYRR